MNKTAKIENTPMSDSDIKKYFKDATIYKYNELVDFQDIDELFENTPYFFLLYLDSKNSGHWCVCAQDKENNTLYMFDSYGYKPDDELSFVGCKERKQLGTTHTYLTNLFNKSKYTVFYNNFDYQGKTSQTCGRHCCFFLLNHLNNNMDLEDYYKYMKKIHEKTKYTYDEIVSKYITK